MSSKAPFLVDGIAYRVLIHKGGIKRGVAILDGPEAGRVLTGGVKFATIGTYYNYTLALSPDPEHLDDYDKVHEVLRSPKRREHRITVPFGQKSVTYDAYVSNLDDELQFIINGRNYWDGLSVKFTAVDPNEIP